METLSDERLLKIERSHHVWELKPCQYRSGRLFEGRFEMICKRKEIRKIEASDCIKCDVHDKSNC